jgi:hypothetical protein
MLGYKRNQVEEAIARVLERGATEPSMELRTRLKRLLETDRALGRSPRASDPERTRYAFFSAEAPGRGAEVWFSEYEAFALLLGLDLMRHGWTQGFSVSVLRRVRADLERHHGRILRQGREELFDQAKIKEGIREGSMVLNNTDPVFLVMVSKPVAGDTQPMACGICRGQDEAMKLVSDATKGVGGTVTMLEFVNSVHALGGALARTKPQPRGRS